MDRLNELTIGDVLKALSRYRPFLLTIVGVALIAVVLPGTRATDDVVATGPNSGPTRVNAGTTGTGTSTEATATSTGGTGAGGASTGGTRTSASSTGGGTATDTGEVTGGGPAPATQFVATDPLDAPDCDRATGRIMIPSNLAPNCVALWPAGADNSGVTYQGVTADTIKIAIYTAQDNDQANAIVADAGFEDNTDEEEDDANREKVIEAFEAHYETYGRHVVAERLYATGEGDDDAAARADAILAANEMAVFAVIGGPGGTNAFTDELAARGVLCFCTVSQPIENYLAWAPHVWSTLMASTQGYMHRAAMACRLKGQPAEWAATPDLAIQERKLGLLYYETADGAYGLGADFFEVELASRCGWHLTDRMAYLLDLTRSAEDARIMIARMKDKGINTVVFAGDPLTPIFLTKEATNQNYFPEWLVTGSALTDTTFFARTYAQEQWSQAFGVSFLVARVDPSYTAGEPNLVEWHFGEELTSYPSIIPLGQLYIGLQLAGPILNPQTYRDGMFSYAPTGGFLTDYAVSWGRGIWPWDDYLALDDTTELWWDATARGTDEEEIDGVGMYRYVDGGKRYMPNDWPTDKPKAFVPEGTVTLYPERPEQDRPPAYEHNDHHHRGPQG